VKDVIVTVAVATVLAIAFMYGLLSCAFSGWGDRPRDGVAMPSSRSVVVLSDRSVRPFPL
jgi:hypothetical protein